MLIERLLQPSAYPHPTAAIRLIETHISWVILTGPFAYKLKKPVSLGFVDYSTLALRRRSCEGEVRVSGRFAPGIYLGAVPVTGSAEQPRVGGDGEPIEWAVKLVQFDEADRLDARFEAGLLTATDCRSLGEAIATIEDRLPASRPGDRWGTAEAVLEAAAVNVAVIREHVPEASERVDALERWLRERLEALTPLLRERQAAGRIRECHGDLHLANIVLHEGSMTPFDAIEFSDNLRWIDVANDVAFLSMDLKARGRPDLAAHVVSSWVEAADDHVALPLMPAYEAYRALVRASIAAIRAGQGCAASRNEALRYLGLAERLAVGGRPVLIATSGVSGSGKSTVAAELVAAVPAIRIRSDVERKRLAGLKALERPEGEAATAAIYSEASTRRVYDRLADLAGVVLDAGVSAIVDASCTRRWQRGLLAAVAEARSVLLIWIGFDLPEDAVLARVEARRSRGGDPSDATADVVRAQVAAIEPIGDDETVGLRAVVRASVADAEAGPAAVVARVLEAREALAGRQRA